MIRKAEIKDLPIIVSLTTQVKRIMLERGNPQWDSHYPGEKEYKADVQLGELYVEEEEGDIAGWMTLNNCFPKEYEGVGWNTLSPANTIHRLAVNPHYKGKGIACRLLSFAEGFSCEQGKRSIRLDTFSLNQAAQKLFLKNGYRYVGQIYMKGRSVPYVCFEKNLFFPY